jgi:predicted  nucleic acid-binding Zn-ribbon protein
VSVLEQLLSVQEHDTALEQLRHRLDHLPERAALEALDERSANATSRRAEASDARDDLVRQQRRFEDEIAAVEAKILTVDGQLYGGSVSSPRELQALQDEIGALRRRTDDLETQLLEILTSLEPIDGSLEALDAEDVAIADERAAATASLAASVAEVEAEIATEEAARADAASGLPEQRVAEYEDLRGRLGGIAVARLAGTSCGGCHLTLSAVEIDRIRKLPPDEPGMCEECGRMLVH